MKKFLLFIGMSSLLLLNGACHFLDVESPNDIDADLLFTDAASAENALAGLYSSMQKTEYYGGNYLLLGEALCLNSATGGFDNPNLDEFGAQAVAPSNLLLEELWVGLYNTIANANRLLEGLDKIPAASFEAGQREAIEGQARAIRALAHFDALRYFGEHWKIQSKYGIPVVDKVLPFDAVVPRSTVAQSYDFILGDLLKALTLVEPDNRDIPYFNTASINALTARLCLYAGDKARATELTTTVIDDGAYALLPPADYAAVFNSRQTSESIFELVFDAQNRSRYNGLTYARPDALSTEVNFMAASDLQTFFDARPGDVRSALLDFNPDNNDATIQPNGRSQKYRGEATEDNPAFVIRLAEMYLIRAEALGLGGGGLDDVNTVRSARGLAAIDPSEVASEADFLNLVLDERRAEFNFEGQYYFDLARTLQYAARTGVDDFRAILPIPAREITTSGGAIEQNPGY